MGGSFCRQDFPVASLICDNSFRITAYQYVLTNESNCSSHTHFKSFLCRTTRLSLQPTLFILSNVTITCVIPNVIIYDVIIYDVIIYGVIIYDVIIYDVIIYDVIIYGVINTLHCDYLYSSYDIVREALYKYNRNFGN